LTHNQKEDKVLKMPIVSYIFVKRHESEMNRAFNAIIRAIPESETLAGE
jgi:hypothetical protein